MWVASFIDIGTTEFNIFLRETKSSKQKDKGISIY